MPYSAFAEEVPPEPLVAEAPCGFLHEKQQPRPGKPQTAPMSAMGRSVSVFHFNQP